MLTRFAKIGGTASLVILACLGLSAAATAKPQAPQQIRPNIGNLSPVGESVFHPISPVRILDTRDGTGGKSTKFTPGSTFNLQVTGGAVPAGATAVAVNLITAHSDTGSFLTVYPTGATRPLAAAINFGPGVFNNMATVALSASGQMAIFDNGATVDVIVDVEGYYGPSVATGSAGYQAYVTASDGGIINSYANNGGGITFANGGTGVNTITFSGANIAAFLVANANIQVTPAGVVGAECSVLAGASGASLNVAVRCFDPAGNPVDSTFYLHVTG